jgi:hypothetical protein
LSPFWSSEWSFPSNSLYPGIGNIILNIDDDLFKVRDDF